MKKRASLIAALLCIFLLTACGKTKAAQPTRQPDAQPSAQPTAQSAAPQVEASPAAATDLARIIEPMPSVLDITALDNCSFSVGFTAKDIYLEDDSRLVIRMTVYDAEYFAAEAVAEMEPGGFIVLNDAVVEIGVLACGEYGSVIINDRFELTPAESGNYAVTENGAQVYCPVGEITVPVAQEFLFRDCSDISKGEQIIYPGDMITDIAGGERVFTPDSTTVTVSESKILGLSVIPRG